MMPVKSAAMAVLALLAVTIPTAAVETDSDSFVVRAGRILPVSPEMPWAIDNGVMVVREGRIVAVGTDIEVPPDLPVIEFPDAIVMPGMVAAASDLGGMHRGDESVAAGYAAVDAFDRYADYAETLAAGVTTVHVNPGTSRLVTGQGAVVKLGGPPAGRVLRDRADLAVNLGPSVLNPPPDITFSFPASADVKIPQPIPQRPGSRMGQLLALDEAISHALDGTTRDHYTIHGPALARAWNDKLPMRLRADRTADLDAAIRFLREKQRPGYVVVSDGPDAAAKALREAKVPMVYQPHNPLRSFGGDIGLDPNAVEPSTCDYRALDGVQFALAPPAGQPTADLRLVAMTASGAGLQSHRAVEAITRVPAEILGIADRVGSLAPGKDADFLVLSGAPLSTLGHVQRVYISGRCVFEPPAGGSLVVKAGTVWAGPGKTIENGQVLMEKGKIVAVGQYVPHPPFARVIDVRPGGFVAPGFIDAHGHLGLQGDRSAVGNDVRLSKLLGAVDVTDRRVSAAGVTTVLLSPYTIGSSGSSVAAVKTAGNRREDRVIGDPAAVLLDVSNADPTTVQETLGRPLAAGKKYLDAWTKYEKDLKEFLEKQKKGEATDAKKESKEEETKQPGDTDPISGTWNATVTGVPTPEPVTLTVAIQLIGNSVEGRITQSSMGVTGRLSGTFDGKHVSAKIEVDAPDVNQPAQLEADLVGDDHLQGTVNVMGLSAKIEARRVDKGPVELKVVKTRRRLQGKDGRPLPPKVDPALEPLKALLEKKIPAVVNVSTPAQIREVLALLVDKHDLPVVLLNAEGASVHAAKLAEKKVTVIVPPAVLRKKDYLDYLQADELARAGVPVAFQSDLEDGARNLPAVVRYAVERGLGAEEALAALTCDAAKAFKIDGRVGTIEPGKDADLVIFSRHPFEGGSRVLRIVVNGEEVRP